MLSRRKRTEEYLLDKAARKAANLAGLRSSIQPLHQGTYAGGVKAAAPKSEAYRDAALLEMVRGRPCLMRVPGVCNGDPETTVAAHSNWPDHSKAMGRKAGDCYIAASCYACHTWLDAGKAPGRDKRFYFMAAHARQILAWRVIATDPSEPERFRKAAARALAYLNATPIPEAD